MEAFFNQVRVILSQVQQIDPFLWTLIILVFSFLLGFAFRSLFFRTVRLYTRRRNSRYGKSLLTHLGSRTKLFFPLLLFWLLQPAIHLPEPYDDILQKGVQALLIINFGWVLLKLINVLEDAAFFHYQDKHKNDLRGRKVRTQLQFLKRIIGVIIFILVLASVLLTFEEVKEIGATILTSAGVAGIIFGIAAQKTLANFIAGIQIALTQPIKIDDSVIVEDEWGTIEEITLTYVVVRIWDKRRIVLPITYFIERPFQNWTRSSAELLGIIMLYVDYSLPIANLRAQLSQILTEEPLWDQQASVIQVVDTTERTMVLRVLVSSNSAPNTWTLRCNVREKLINYIQAHYPSSLPKTRMTFPDLEPMTELKSNQRISETTP